MCSVISLVGSCEYHFVVVLHPLHMYSYLMRPFYHVLTNKIPSLTLVLFFLDIALLLTAFHMPLHRQLTIVCH